MISFVLRRFLHLIPILLIVSFVVFGMLLLLPGDPTLTLLGDFASAEQRAALAAKMGLDQPIWVQYWRWLSTLLSGDFGRSLRTHEPVLEMLGNRIPVTLQLTLMSLGFAILIGIPLGIIAALRRNKVTDSVISTVGIAGVAMPNFWQGILLIMLFSVTLAWLPPSGYVPIWVDPVQNLRLMIMPTIVIGTSLAAVVLRQTRASMLQVMSQDYVRTARAKGVSEFNVIVGHALRNALIPIVTVLGLQFGSLIGGVVITELIFNLPGLGRMIVDGIFERDFAPVQAGILFVVIGTLVINLVTDLLYALLDKRVKLS